MGVQLAQSSSRRGNRRVSKPVSDINITPMVDVMLVLLVIFMVTAPMLTVGVPVDLPHSDAPPLATTETPLTVTIQGDGQLFLQETAVQPDALIPRLQAIVGTNPETRIFVRGDKLVPYGKVMEVMGIIASAGYTKVALMAEMPQGPASISTLHKKP